MGPALIFFGLVVGIPTVLTVQEGRKPPKWIDVIAITCALSIGIGVAISVIEVLE